MDKRVTDITGKKFGKLTALRQVKVEGRNHAMWICRCDCGNEMTTAGTTLRRGQSKSCGCTTNQFEGIQIKKMNLEDYNEGVKLRLAQKTKLVNGCLEWQPEYKTNGSLPLSKDGKSHVGYGLIRYGKKTIPAHRASWIVHKGDIPDGLMVLHMCDNPLCVNIKHLYLGSAQDNVDDKMARSRHHGNLKYSEEIRNEALELRKNGMKCKDIQVRLSIPKKSLADIFKKLRKNGVDV